MRRGVPKSLEFDDAYLALLTLENRALMALVDEPLQPLEVLYWHYPAEVIDGLCHAYPLIRLADRTRTMTQLLYAGAILSVDLHAAKCCYPDLGRTAIQDTPYTAKYTQTLTELTAEHRQFDKVREVIAWLNAHATPGAARHYCPWLGSLLPSDHAYHAVKGTKFQDVGIPLDVANTMRECGVIIARALLARSPEYAATVCLGFKCQRKAIRSTDDMAWAQIGA